MDDKGLAQQLKRGQQVTLVWGAGVSRSPGLPLRSDLLRGAWKIVNGNDPYAVDTRLLECCQAACRVGGVPTDFIERLDIRRHPLGLQAAGLRSAATKNDARKSPF